MEIFVLNNSFSCHPNVASTMPPADKSVAYSDSVTVFAAYSIA